MKILIEYIKKSEGFEGSEYKDHLGFSTLGYGTKLPLSKDEAELLLKYRLNKKIEHLLQEKPFIVNLDDNKQAVLYEMAYQLGVGGLLRFKRMWSAIKSTDFEKASIEMLDSLWAKQTPTRAKELAFKMKKV